jgi:hypothetical protein
MLGFELAEKLSRRSNSCLFRILEALTDAFLRVSPGRNVKQALIGFRILHNGRSFTLHGKYNRALGLLQLFHEIAGAAPEGRQGLNVTRNVKH